MLLRACQGHGGNVSYWTPSQCTYVDGAAPKSTQVALSSRWLAPIADADEVYWKPRLSYAATDTGNFNRDGVEPLSGVDEADRRGPLRSGTVNAYSSTTVKAAKVRFVASGTKNVKVRVIYFVR